MSTKIYQGYWMELDWFDFVLAKCIKARKAVIKRRNAMILKQLKEATDDTKGMMEDIFDSMRSRQIRIEQTKLRDPEIDYKVEASFFATKDKILVIVFSEKEELTKTLVKSLGLQFYGYWNNTDPDENCSAEEWRQRKKDWNKVLKGSGIPSESSMSFTFSNGLPDFLDQLITIRREYKPKAKGTSNKANDNRKGKKQSSERRG